MGIWLAFSKDDYALWDGWIIAAIILWIIGGYTGGRAGAEYGRSWSAHRSSNGPASRRSPASFAPRPASSCSPFRLSQPSSPDRHDLEAGRMSVLAAHRADRWNFPLFVHVLGAMILVGGLLAGAPLAFARGDTRCCGSATGRSSLSRSPATS